MFCSYLTLPSPPSLACRFTQAGSEVSALLGRIPSAVGYQPTLATDMGTMQERITTTQKGSITSVQVRRYCSAYSVVAWGLVLMKKVDVMVFFRVSTEISIFCWCMIKT